MLQDIQTEDQIKVFEPAFVLIIMQVGADLRLEETVAIQLLWRHVDACDIAGREIEEP